MSDGPEVIPQERIVEMRQAIHQHLQKSGMYNEIRNIIDTYAADHPDFNPNSSDDFMKVLRDRGLMGELLSRLQQQPQQSSVGSVPLQTASKRSFQGLKAGHRYLHIRVLQGRAFLDHLDIDPAFAKSNQMVVVLQFGSQRFRCVPQQCSVDPQFDDDFLVCLDDGGSSSIGSTDLMDISTPLHLAVVREDCSFTRCSVLGENTVDWRKVLKSGFLTLSVELCGENPGVPAGVLEMQIELIPGCPRRTEDEIVSRLELQRTAITAADREFLIYARRWWNEFQQMRPTHCERKVKVFAATSSGRMVPVTHFVSVLQPDRVLESPYAAARFVSLFAVTKDEDLTREVLSGSRGPSANNGGSMSSTQGDVWVSPFLFLSQRRGDICNHATLLCSLLLGFGLDAYCAVGTLQSGASYMFCLTRKKLAPGEFDVTYWDPATGERHAPTTAHPFLTIGCAFNNLAFYANVQPSDNAVTVHFDLENESNWKALHPLKLRVVPKGANPPLLWIPLNTRVMEVELETALQRLVGVHRDGIGMPTRWDSDMALVLTQALSAYEEQRVMNHKQAELQMFQQCVKGKIGDGKTFRGVPLNVSHVSESKILSAWLASGGGKEVLNLVGDDLKFALRVKVFPFPEGVVSVWIMIAASYRVPLT